MDGALTKGDAMTGVVRYARAGLALCLLVGTPALAQTSPVRRLTLDDGRRIAAAAQAHARSNGWHVVVTVLDEGGHAILLERMDGTQIASVEIALAKGRSAAAFRRPTREMADWVAGGNVGLLALPGLVPVEGGLPLIVDGQVVGAVGVSGATARQDGEVAQVGAAALTSRRESQTERWR
jgi:glc operon protein GlcG